MSEKWKMVLFRTALITGILLLAFETVYGIDRMLHLDLVNNYNGNVIRDFIKSLLELALLLYALFAPKMRLQLGLLFFIEAVFHEVVLSSGYVTVVFTAALCIPYVIAVIGCILKKKALIMIGTIWGIIDQILLYQNHKIDYFASVIECFSVFSVMVYRMIIFLILLFGLLVFKGKIRGKSESSP